MKRKPHESTPSFKERIAELMRKYEGREDEPVLRNKAPSILVRKPTDRGYYPPPRKRK